MTIKRIKPWIFVSAVLLMSGIIGSLWVLNRPHGSWVEVLQDNVVLYRLDLSTSEDQMIEVEYDGRISTVQIENHQIRVYESDCPDHTCVNMGWLDSAMPIICLPNHLAIQFIDSEDEVDMIVN